MQKKTEKDTRLVCGGSKKCMRPDKREGSRTKWILVIGTLAVSLVFMGALYVSTGVYQWRRIWSLFSKMGGWM